MHQIIVYKSGLRPGDALTAPGDVLFLLWSSSSITKLVTYSNTRGARSFQFAILADAGFPHAFMVRTRLYLIFRHPPRLLSGSADCHSIEETQTL